MKQIITWIITMVPLVMFAQQQNATGNKVSSGKNIIWSLGVEPSLPIGHFNDLASFGVGASLQGEYKSGKAGITLNMGYIDYFGKTVDSISYSDFKYWPLLAGLKYYMGKTYLHGQAGAGFGSNGLGTSFWYGGGIGMNFTKAVDAELKYTGWNQGTVNKNNGGTNAYGGSTGGGSGGYGGHYPTIGLRLAYNF